MITPIKRTFERQISSASLEFSCEEEQKCCLFKVWYFIKLVPFSLNFQQSCQKYNKCKPKNFPTSYEKGGKKGFYVNMNAEKLSI